MLALRRVDVDCRGIGRETHNQITCSNGTNRIIPTSASNHTPSILADKRVTAGRGWRSPCNRHDTDAYRRWADRPHYNLDRLTGDGNIGTLATKHAAGQENAGAGFPGL